MSQRRLLIAILSGLGGAGVLALAGVQLWFALAWGVAVSALVAITGSPIHEDNASWPPEVPTPVPAGSEIARLAWSFHPTTGEAGPMVVRRLRRLVSHRLTRLGLDLDDPADRPAIDQLLGSDVAGRLTNLRLTGADAQAVLVAVERLSALPPPDLNRP